MLKAIEFKDLQYLNIVHFLKISNLFEYWKTSQASKISNTFYIPKMSKYLKVSKVHNKTKVKSVKLR